MGAHPPVLWRGLLALLALLHLLSPGSSQGVKEENGLEGGTIQLNPTFTGTVGGFTWKKGENKIVEVDFPPGELTYYGPAEKHSLDKVTGVLDIRDLTVQDEGQYKAEVLINSKYTYSYFELRVFPALRQPRVECSITNGNVTIRCHLDGEYSKPFNYVWDKLDTRQEYSLTDNNKTLTVINAKREPLESLRCVMVNPAARNSSSVPLSTCFPEEGNRNRYMILFAFMASFLAFALIGIFYFLKKDGYVGVATEDNGQNTTGQPDSNDGQNTPGQPGPNAGQNTPGQPGPNAGQNTPGQPGPNADQITKTDEDETTEAQEPLLTETKSPSGHQQSQESLGDQITKTDEDETTEAQEPLLPETKSPSGHQQSQESLGGPSTHDNESTVKNPTANKEQIHTDSSSPPAQQKRQNVEAFPDSRPLLSSDQDDGNTDLPNTVP